MDLVHHNTSAPENFSISPRTDSKHSKNYLEQPDVWASCNENKPQDGKLHSFTDGQIWTRSVQENFVHIHMYSDEVEMCDSIGSRKTIHKLSAF